MYIFKAAMMFVIGLLLAYFSNAYYARDGLTAIFSLLFACTIAAGVISIYTLYREY